MPKPDAKRYSIGFRTTKDLKDALDTAAAESGRSLAQEVEHRLELSFFREQEIYGGPHTEALVKALGMTIQLIEANRGKRWTEDADTAAEMIAAVEGIIRALVAVPPGLLREKLAQRDSAQMVRTMDLALNLFGLSDKDRAEAYAKGAGKPSTPKK